MIFRFITIRATEPCLNLEYSGFRSRETNSPYNLIGGARRRLSSRDRVQPPLIVKYNRRQLERAWLRQTIYTGATTNDNSYSGSKLQMDSFDVDAYLKVRYGDVNDQRAKFQLGKLHELFSTIPKPNGEGLKVLDFGSGPVIQHCISVAAHASEIVFSDISESNRHAVQKWLNKETDAFNWSPHFDYVVKTLEGKGEKEAREREEKVRQIAKIIYCDALSPTSVQKGFEGPYDIVLEFGALEVACSDKDIYRKCTTKVASLLKHGGRFVHYGSNFNRHDHTTMLCHVGALSFPFIRLTHEFVSSILREDGFTDVCVDFTELEPENCTHYYPERNGFHFVTAKR